MILTPFTDFAAALDEAAFSCVVEAKPFCIVNGCKTLRGVRVMHVVPEEDAEDFDGVLHVEHPAAVIRERKPKFTIKARKYEKRTVDGIPLMTWCRLNKPPVTYRKILARIEAGMSIEEAISTPAGKRNQQASSRRRYAKAGKAA